MKKEKKIEINVNKITMNKLILFYILILNLLKSTSSKSTEIITKTKEENKLIELKSSNLPKVICYYGSWSHWRSKPGKLSPDSIDPYLCTHLIYSFAKIDPITFNIISADPTLDLNENTWSVNGYNKFNSLKLINPKLKTQISIGGWDEGSKIFSNLVHNKSAIETFTYSLITFIIKYNFDGIDLDWEYPGQRSNSRSTDSKNYLQLIKFINEKFNGKYIISIAVPGSQYIAKSTYPDDEIFDYVDHVHLMTYDYYGPWTYVVGHTAPLFSRTSTDSRSINSSINYWLTRVNSDKLFIGISLYGRTFILRNKNDKQPLSLADGEGITGLITKIPGVLSYFESCSFVSSPKTTKSWDFLWSTPYAVQEQNWVSIEDPTSITAKATFIKVNNLAGAVIWSLDHDDITGTVCEESMISNKSGKKSSTSTSHNLVKSRSNRPFSLTSIVSNILLESTSSNTLREKEINLNSTVNLSSSTTGSTVLPTIIYVSDLTTVDKDDDDDDDDVNEKNNQFKSDKYSCKVNCDDEKSNLKSFDLNTESTELTVTNTTIDKNVIKFNTQNILQSKSLYLKCNFKIQSFIFLILMKYTNNYFF